MWHTTRLLDTRGGLEGCRTFLDPLIQAGFVTLARNGMVFIVLIRETLLNGVLVNVRRDMVM